VTLPCALCERANVLSKRAAMSVRDTRSVTVGGVQAIHGGATHRRPREELRHQARAQDAASCALWPAFLDVARAPTSSGRDCWIARMIEAIESISPGKMRDGVIALRASHPSARCVYRPAALRERQRLVGPPAARQLAQDTSVPARRAAPGGGTSRRGATPGRGLDPARAPLSVP
jgi:hypothetical protein